MKSALNADINDEVINPFPTLIPHEGLGIPSTSRPQYVACSSEKRYRSPQILFVYSPYRIIVCVLGQYEYPARKKWGRFIRFGATAAPLEPDLVWTDADTGGTTVRDHPKAVGSCAKCLDGRDIIYLVRLVRPIHNTHLMVCTCVSGQLAGVRAS